MNFFTVAAFVCSIFLNAKAEYRFDSWTTDNGLPQISVNSILQTRDGFLWLTTFGGLARYDGLRFQVFNSGNTKGLRTSRFLNLFEDKDGNLWITTEGQGVARYLNGTFTTYTVEDGLADNMIQRIRKTVDGSLLFDGDNQTVEWKNGGFAPYLSSAAKKVLFTNRSGAIWSFDQSHLQKTENDRIVVDYQTEFTVLRVFEDSTGRVWIAGDRNALFMLKDGELTDFTKKGSFPEARFSTIFEDADGAIWFGMYDSEVYRFEDGKNSRV